MIDRLIEDERGRDRLLAFISRRALPFRAAVTDGRPRSTDQNRLMWHWAAEATAQLGDRTARELQIEWKLRFGVPVMMEEDPKFADMWAELERYSTWQQRLRVIEYFDITSKLSVAGFARMLDEIFRVYTGPDHGLELTDTEERHHGPKIGSRVDRGGTGPSDTTIGKKKDREASEREVRGLYAGLQREAPASDGSQTSTDKRRGE